MELGEVAPGTAGLRDSGSQDAGVLSREALVQAIASAQERAQSLKMKIAELERALTSTEQEEELLQRLLSLREGKIGSEVTAGRLPQSKKSADVRHPVVEQVLAILEKAGHPVHISELMRTLADAGAEIPGAGTQANLISHLRREPMIVRPSRGVYALAAWGFKEMAAKKGGARRRRRADRKAANTGSRNQKGK